MREFINKVKSNKFATATPMRMAMWGATTVAATVESEEMVLLGVDGGSSPCVSGRHKSKASNPSSNI